MKKSNLWWPVILVVSLAMAADTPSVSHKKRKLTLRDLLNASSSTYTHSTTVAGVRGLEDTNAGVDTKARDFAAIDRLDKNVVGPQELPKFLSEGKLQ